MPNSDDGSDSENGEQVRVSFSLASEVVDRSLEVATEPIAVPADIGRKGLTAVINHLLDRRVTPAGGDDEESVSSDEEDKLPALAFDFILGDKNKLLRTGVEREARRHGLSLEQTIPITYFPAQGPPELSGEGEKVPDWLSCMTYVSSSSHDLLCTGTYDGSIFLYRPSKNASNDDDEKISATLDLAVSTSAAHTGPIKCLAAATAKQEENVYIATGSLDQTIAVHTFDPKSNSIKLYATCQDGHSSSVGSLDMLFGSNKLLASGDWDGNLCLWDLSGTEEENEESANVPSKKMKTDSNKSSKKQRALSITPTASFQAHSSQISGISWGNYDKQLPTESKTPRNSTSLNLITGSWDHSLKVWDMQRQECLLTLNGSRVIACLDTSYHSHGIVATGHPDCTIRLWDVRLKTSATSSSNNASALAVSDKTFKPSHKAWVSSVQWSQRNPYHLASTSHDGTVKVWDIRSSLPLHTVRAFPKTEKGLCMAYGGKNKKKGDGQPGNDATTIFVGGTDCIVKQFVTQE